jgi:hypothetical protein
MIVSFMGEYASGKDFLCDFLVREYKAIRLSFSDEVRRLTVKIHPWMPFDFDPSIKDKPFIHPMNPHGLTPREIWLNVGLVRSVDPKYFVNAFSKETFASIDFSANAKQLYIITDFRTQDEWEFLEDNNVPIIKIERENRDGLIPSEFEKFVRQFKQYDYLYINHMDGTDRFKVFFDNFLKRTF